MLPSSIYLEPSLKSSRLLNLCKNHPRKLSNFAAHLNNTAYVLESLTTGASATNKLIFFTQ
jgi:hypothetical protein